jgi:hypothetical protein
MEYGTDFLAMLQTVRLSQYRHSSKQERIKVMSEINSLSLALVDFIPSIAFVAGAYFLFKLVRRECGKVCTYILLAGSSLVFLAGFFKAIWKLLYVTNIADVRLLSELQFVLLAPGFLLILISAVWFSRLGRTTHLPLLAMVPWKIPLLIVMVLSSLGMHATLAYTCFQRHTKMAGVGFIIAFLCVLGMGGMASGEQSVLMQWIEEGINSVGQIGFAVGCYLLFQVSTSRSVAAR